jgi:hypothetical protein
MSAKTIPDSRRAWKKAADIRAHIIRYLEADVDAMEKEIKQLLAERAACTCQSKNTGHGN